MVVSTGQVISASDINYGANMPVGIITVWSGSIANIAAGWIICDGLNGTPNLLGKFVEGVATASTNPGATGGNVSHKHTIPIVNNMTLGGNQVVQTSSTDSTDGRPPFYDVAFLYKT